MLFWCLTGTAEENHEVSQSGQEFAGLKA